MEISKEEITRMLQEAYAEGFNTAIECLKSAKDGIAQTFAARQSVEPTIEAAQMKGKANDGN